MVLETPQELVKKLIEAGFSQAVIAERAGVKQPTISRILSGEHTDPKSSVLIRLKQFADEEDDKQPPIDPDQAPNQSNHTSH